MTQPLLDTEMNRDDSLAEDLQFIRRLTARLTRNETVAEDIAQETALTVLTSGPDHPEARRSWIRQVALNHARRVAREESRRRRREALVARPEVRREANDRSFVVREAIRGVMELREPDRSTVLLRFYADCSIAEIARLTKVTERAVRRRLQRGIARIRKALDLGSPKGRSTWVGALVRWDQDPRIEVSDLQAQCRGLSKQVHKLLHPTAPAITLQGLALYGITLLSGLIALCWFGYPRLKTLSPSLLGGTSNLETVTSNKISLDLQAHRPTSTAENEDRREETLLPRESAPPKTQPVGGTLTVRFLWGDETPASNIQIGCRPDPGERLKAQDFRHRTDQNGEVVLTGLSPGRFRIAVLRNKAFKFVDIREGEQLQLEVQLQSRAPLGIRVLSPSGDPVAHADILMGTDQGEFDRVQKVGMTDSKGQFTLRDVSSVVFLSANASGFGPSRRTWYPGFHRPTGTVGIDLQLTQSGGSLTGTVLDHAQNPVAGAKVLVRTAQRPLMVAQDHGSVKMPPSPLVTETDSQGSFSFSDLPTGPIEVHAATSGSTLFQTELDPEDPPHLVAILAEPGSVEGRLLDPRGEPVAGARVFAASTLGSPLDSIRTTITDITGGFRFGDLPPGDLDLIFWPPTNQGTIDRRVRVLSGDTVLIKVDADSGRALQGNVRFQDGEPARGFVVRARPSFEISASPLRRKLTPRGTAECTTSGDGSFRLPNHPDRLHFLQVFPPSDHLQIPCLELAGIPADNRDFVLKIPRLDGSIRGRVRSPGDAPPPPFLITIDPVDRPRDGDSESTQVRGGKDGTFVLKRIPAGEYRIGLVLEKSEDSSMWEGSHSLGDFSLLTGETLDLGEIPLPESARLSFLCEMEGSESVVPLILFHTLSDAEGARRVGRREDNRIVFDLLPAGRHRFAIGGGVFPAVACQSLVVESRPGSSAEFVVPLRKGIPSTVEIHEPAGQRFANLCWLEIKDVHGHLVNLRKIRRSEKTRPRQPLSNEKPRNIAEDLGTFSRVFYLEPGTYDLTATNDADQRGEARLLVPTDGSPSRCDLRLHP